MLARRGAAKQTRSRRLLDMLTQRIKSASSKRPSALALAALGTAGVAFVRRRRAAAANEPSGDPISAEQGIGSQEAPPDLRQPAQERSPAAG